MSNLKLKIPTNGSVESALTGCPAPIQGGTPLASGSALP